MTHRPSLRSSFENGGSTPAISRATVPAFGKTAQYTTALSGLLWAFSSRDEDDGLDILKRCFRLAVKRIYRTEPYVLAADVYSARDHVGAAAGLGTQERQDGINESLWKTLGLKLRGGKLHVHPKLLSRWEGYAAVWKNAGKSLRSPLVRGQCVGDPGRKTVLRRRGCYRRCERRAPRTPV